MTCPMMQENYKIQFGSDYYSNTYTAHLDCPNCNDTATALVRKGVPLHEVKLICQRCEAVNYWVRP